VAAVKFVKDEIEGEKVNEKINKKCCLLCDRIEPSE